MSATSYAAYVRAEADSGIRSLLTVSQLSRTLGLSVSWIYRRTGPKATDPVPVVRLGRRGVRFDPEQVLLYIRSRERHIVSGTRRAASQYGGIANSIRNHE